MAINYSILPNKLIDDPTAHAAKVKDLKPIYQDELIEMMNIPGQVTKTESTAVLTSFKSIIKSKLAEGYTVITDLNRYRVSISGSFEHDEDTFDPERHKIKLNCTPSKEMKEAVQSLRFKRVDAKKPSPRINKVIDTFDDSSNISLTIGWVSEIRGRLLKFDASDNEQGIFLIQADGTEYRCTHYIINKPATVMFYIPNNVPEGYVSLVVRSNLLNENDLRSFTFDGKLNVQSV